MSDQKESKKRKWPFDLEDYLIIGALIFIFTGLYQIHPAYAFTCVGFLLLVLGLAIALFRPRKVGD